jgi:hypothetical protein
VAGVLSKCKPTESRASGRLALQERVDEIGREDPRLSPLLACVGGPPFVLMGLGHRVGVLINFDDGNPHRQPVHRTHARLLKQVSVEIRCDLNARVAGEEINGITLDGGGVRVTMRVAVYVFRRPPVRCVRARENSSLYGACYSRPLKNGVEMTSQALFKPILSSDRVFVKEDPKPSDVEGKWCSLSCQ